MKKGSIIIILGEMGMGDFMGGGGEWGWKAC